MAFWRGQKRPLSGTQPSTSVRRGGPKAVTQPCTRRVKRAQCRGNEARIYAKQGAKPFGTGSCGQPSWLNRRSWYTSSEAISFRFFASRRTRRGTRLPGALGRP